MNWRKEAEYLKYYLNDSGLRWEMFETMDSFEFQVEWRDQEADFIIDESGIELKVDGKFFSENTGPFDSTDDALWQFESYF